MRATAGIMRAIATAAAIAAGVGLAIGAGPASAAGTKTLSVSNPRPNTVVLVVANNDIDDSINCAIYGYGPTQFQARMTVAPRNSKSSVVSNVPAGNYTLSWGCNSFAQEKHYITVSGTGGQPSQPYTTPGGTPSETGGGFGSLGSLAGSS